MRSHFSPVRLCDPRDCRPAGSSVHGILQEYWSELPCPPPGDLPDPGIEPESLTSLALGGRVFTMSAPWEALVSCPPGQSHDPHAMPHSQPLEGPQGHGRHPPTSSRCPYCPSPSHILWAPLPLSVPQVLFLGTLNFLPLLRNSFPLAVRWLVLSTGGAQTSAPRSAPCPADQDLCLLPGLTRVLWLSGPHSLKLVFGFLELVSLPLACDLQE